MLTKKDLQSISSLNRDIMKQELRPVLSRLAVVENKVTDIYNRLKKMDKKIDHLHLPPLKRVN